MFSSLKALIDPKHEVFHANSGNQAWWHAECSKLRGKDRVMAFELKSVFVRENEIIAKKHTCNGADVSVPLNWTDPPEGTKSFALIVDDPDAPSGTFVHWVLYDLPGDVRLLAEKIPPKTVLDNGAKQGLNDFHKLGYRGPCPPPGLAHRYVFTLYALNSMTGLLPGATKQQLLGVMKGHILAEAQLIGMYAR